MASLVARDDPRREDTVIALPSLMKGWVPSATRDRAARSSPWLPVHRYRIWSAGQWLGLVVRQAAIDVGEESDVRAAAVMRCIDRPARATRRGLLGADHAVHAGDVRGEASDRDPALETEPISSFRPAATSVFRPGLAFDEDVGRVAHHGQHALVAEAGDGLDVGGSPITGSGSIFQSPVCNTAPSGVRIARPLGSAIEWVMR
jgi:hypothetical protein